MPKISHDVRRYNEPAPVAQRLVDLRLSINTASGLFLSYHAIREPQQASRIIAIIHAPYFHYTRSSSTGGR